MPSIFCLKGKKFVKNMLLNSSTHWSTRVRTIAASNKKIVIILGTYIGAKTLCNQKKKKKVEILLFYLKGKSLYI